jgi:hypothetical protein
LEIGHRVLLGELDHGLRYASLPQLPAAMRAAFEVAGMIAIAIDADLHAPLPGMNRLNEI